MKALVFGGSGYIGKHLITELLKKRHTVINVDKNFLFDIDDPNYNILVCDITNIGEISSVIENNKVDFVYNLAGMSSIADCDNIPHGAFLINVKVNLYIIEAILKYSPETKYVFASSLYAMSGIRTGGIYAITKKCSEDLIKYYHKKEGLKYTILRYETIYGGGAGKDNSIQNIITNAIKNDRVSHYGTGNEQRSYIHVKDVARMSVDLMGSMYGVFDNNTVVMSGPETIKAVDLANMLAEIMGIKCVEFREEKPLNYYITTPYTADMGIAIKYAPDRLIDFGEGLLEVINEIKEKRK